MDAYGSYAELARKQIEGIDYQRLWRASQCSSLLHLAIHGGGIEQGTSELAEAAADSIHDLYVFDGLKPANNSELHITSVRFDEPTALQLVQAASHVVAWHGAAGTAPATLVGGRDYVLRDRIALELTRANFTVQIAPGNLDGSEEANICNRGARRMGVQLELTTAQRQAFFEGGDLSRPNRDKVTPAFTTYVSAVRRAIAQALVTQVRG
ncbi:poly-gamma-glutamate hydrolase family protein [Streptomyces sp. CC224B]|uniref:poly-gamma-glutamate hydrolase family protein n=1 Tax=Streptomyces sp. CC224B TaxID=3044571 RepID=UPI0024A7FA4D|nr:poly-gamma-glutamate hydrolase family protein [Streptomyces sp. CC224B]